MGCSHLTIIGALRNICIQPYHEQVCLQTNEVEEFSFDLTDINQKCNSGIKEDTLIRQLMGAMAAQTT